MSGYVLDGIETAMVAKTGAAWDRINCPCGWTYEGPSASWAVQDTPTHIDLRAALRFHYTHCPKARAPTTATGGTE